MRPLRIFYAAHPSPNARAFPASQLWRWNLYLPLVDLGHDVVELDYDLTPHFQWLEDHAFIREHRPRLERELLRQVEAAHRQKPIDLFFSYFYSACATPETIRAISAMGIMTANWYCNAAHQFHLVEEIAPAYDYCLAPEQFRLDDYRRIGARPIYCQEAANPNVYRPFPRPRDLDVVFMGQRYGDRPAYIGHLLDAGIGVHVWGSGWTPTAPTTDRWRKRVEVVRSPRRLAAVLRNKTRRAPDPVFGPPLSDEVMIRTYSRAKISLGFSAAGDARPGAERLVHMRLRDFEAPMSGAFYMLEYFPEVERFFEVGREIVCYRDPDDLVEKARYFLSQEDERERIREAGRARALRDHTWQGRFEQVFREMGFD